MTNAKSHIIVQTGFIGDIALTFFLLEQIRLQKPNDKIILLTTPAGAEIAQAYPSIVNQVIVFDKRGKHKGIHGLLTILQDVKECRAQTILSLHQSFRTSLLIALSGIPVRIGYSTSSLAFVYTDRYPYVKGIHEIQRQQMLLHGILNHVHSDSNAHGLLRRIVTHGLLSQEPGIVIAPGSVWNTKRWPAEHFKTLIESLLNTFPHRITLIGSMSDKQLCASIMPSTYLGRVYNLAGTLTLNQTMGLLSKSTVLIANDSAPIHLASLVNCPTIALFGPTHPAFGFAPLADHSQIIQLDLDCRPCSIHGQHECPLGSHTCMIGIKPEDILPSVHQILLANA